jgi:hypothetical protein
MTAAASVPSGPTLTMHVRATRDVPELGLGAGQEHHVVLRTQDMTPEFCLHVQQALRSGALAELEPLPDPAEVLVFIEALLARHGERRGEQRRVRQGFD